MIAVALKALAGRKLRAMPHCARDHSRRRDDQRHLRPHGHDRQGVQQRLHVRLRGHGRRRHREVGVRQRGRVRRPASRSPRRCSRGSRRSRARRRGGQRSGLRPAHEEARRPVSAAAARRPRFRGQPRRQRFNPSSSRRVRGRRTGRGRDRRGDGRRTRATSSATSIGVVAKGPVQEFTITGIATFAWPGVARQRDVRGLHAPRRSAALRQGGRARRDSGSRRGRGHAGAARRRDRPRSCRRAPRFRPGIQEAAEATKDIEEFTNIHPVLPPGVRFHRALRRRLRHLQHALDHRCPARARVRDAADDRRLEAPDSGLGDPRGARHRPARIMVGASSWVSGLAKGLTRSSSSFGFDLPRPASCSRRARSSSACSPAY